MTWKGYTAFGFIVLIGTPMAVLIIVGFIQIIMACFQIVTIDWMLKQFPAGVTMGLTMLLLPALPLLLMATDNK